MAEVLCGFNDGAGGVSGAELLATWGPTLLVDIGFDPSFQPGITATTPTPGIRAVKALIDTGAADNCIDSLLASQLNLPIVDRRQAAGAHGALEVNMHLAQVTCPALGFTVWGAFAGVHLNAGGQWHQALIGRTFLRHFNLQYDGRTGTVKISK